jgi:hypothetical protein
MLPGMTMSLMEEEMADGIDSVNRSSAPRGGNRRSDFSVEFAPVKHGDKYHTMK